MKTCLSERAQQIFLEAMTFASRTDEPASFLTCWLEGDWGALKQEWPDYEIPMELTGRAKNYADRVRCDKRIKLYAYQYNVDGHCVAMEPVEGIPPIVIEPSEVQGFLSLVAKINQFERWLMVSSQTYLVESYDNPEMLLATEIPLCEFRLFTSYAQRVASPDERVMIQRLHREAAAWRRQEADLVHIIAYATYSSLLEQMPSSLPGIAVIHGSTRPEKKSRPENRLGIEKQNGTLFTLNLMDCCRRNKALREGGNGGLSFQGLLRK